MRVGVRGGVRGGVRAAIGIGSGSKKDCQGACRRVVEDDRAGKRDATPGRALQRAGGGAAAEAAERL